MYSHTQGSHHCFTLSKKDTDDVDDSKNCYGKKEIAICVSMPWNDGIMFHPSASM